MTNILYELNIPFNGSTYNTDIHGTGGFIPEDGEFYWIYVSGTVKYHTDSVAVFDGIWTRWFDGVWQIHPNHRLQINGTDVGDQEFNSAHQYRFTLRGQGEAFTFRLRDVNYADNSGTLNIQIVPGVPNHDGWADCPFCYATKDGLISKRPISLWGGEKREQITDLSVNTPAGVMAFTRSYRQSKNVSDPIPTTPEDGFTTPLGSGWTHNHDMLLVDQTSKILLKMPSGGLAHFTLDTGGIYIGDPGSNSRIDASGGSLDKYTLTASDESVWVFDADQKLRSCTWANGEVWTYEYYEYPADPLALDGLLKSVSDDYERGLQFAYYDNPSNIDYQQLHYVGDHTVADITAPEEGERFVEFAYTENKKEDSGIVAGGQALLTTMTDVLGEEWTYVYETTDVDALNWIIQEDSPSVNVDGDAEDEPDGAITLKRLTYYPLVDLAVNGDMEADSDWVSVNSPTTNARSSTQKYEGTYSRRVVGDIDDGIEGTVWGMDAGRTYTIRARVYPVSGNVMMRVTGVGAQFPVSSGTGAWQELMLTLGPEVTFSGHKLQFVAAANSSEFYVDAVTIEAAQHITQELGKHTSDADYLAQEDYAFQPGGENITLEKSAGRVTTHRFNGSLHTGTDNPGGEGGVTTQDTSFRPANQQDANGNQTQLVWSTDGKQLNSVTDALNHKTAFKYDTLNRLIISTDAEGRFTLYGYNASERQPNVIRVTDGNKLVPNSDMEDNDNWSGIGSPTTNQQSTAQVFTGDYSRYVVAGAASVGIQSASLKLKQGEAYCIMAYVRPVSGRVKMQLGSATVLSGTGTNQWEELSLVYTPSSDETANLKFLADGGAATFYVDTVGRVVRHQTFTYDLKGRVTSEKLLDPANGSTILQETQRTYGTTGNANGLLESIVQIDMVGSDDQTTSYTYDAQGRVIKTYKSSLMGTCQATYTVYDNAGNVLGTACGLVNTTAPTTIGGLEALYDANDATKKHTRITEHTYDAMGRRVTTMVNAATTFSRTSRTLYDALSRVVRTIENYVVQGNSAPGAWVWNASSERWEYGASDTTPISHGANNDENIIADTDYNARGLVFRRRDVLGRVTLYGYDLADRLVKTIQNASQPDYDMSYATGDPQLRRYVVDATSEEVDVVTEQFYDANGILVKTIDARGSVSYTVYDALNRPTRTVQNAKAAATIALNPGDTGYDVDNDPRVLGDTGYQPSEAPDEDIISETVYDALGRVVVSRRLLENRVPASPVWDETYFVYDELGRQKRVIQHYVVQGSSDPANWVYESGVWKQAAGGTAISHGSNDQNIITETVYDASGRVKETLDVNRRVTRFVYDGLNRQIMTVANYVAQATEPDNWVWRAVSSVYAWRLSASNNTLVDFGTNFDQNIIAFTDYDGDGRIFETRNVEGLVQRNAYDAAGRSYLSVANFVDNSYQSPSSWVWDAGQTRWEDGNNVAIDRGTGIVQNLISQPEYDSENRVFQTRDSRGNLTRFVYDEAGRRVMTISNFVAQANPPEAWEWANNQWEDGSANAISFGTNKDQNRISHTTYDILGRVVSTRDAKGRVSNTVYDTLGRRTLTVANYVAQAHPPEVWEWDAQQSRWEDGSGNAIDHNSPQFDENIISQTVYNRAGQVVSTRDARGTETAFTYDGAGRRLIVTAAANTGQRASTYTCYDKAGRVLRTIQGYTPTGGDPDGWNGSGVWLFAPTTYGYHSDENRITTHVYDKASRRVSTTNPAGDEVETAYFLDGQVDSMTDPMNIVTVYRYDKLNRRKLVVQNYRSQNAALATYTDPATWSWTGSVWQDATTPTPLTIEHGTNKDQNIVVMVTYDIAGRMTQMRDPRGNATTYQYDKLGRRTNLTNPLSKQWVTAYSEVSQAQRTTMTYPGINGGSTYNVVRDFDRMGRLAQIDYNDSANTPKVNFTYDVLGNRLSMVENNGSSNIRQTTYSYDAANRLTQVGFDNDGGGSVDETVSYEYDTGGRRTKLTMPGSLNITYTYDQKGRLIRLTDWDGQATSFTYDKADRHVRTRRSNGLDSLYQHDSAGRLKTLHHLKGVAEIRQTFAYAVNALGNRTQAKEVTPRTSGATATDMDHTYPAIVYRGDWNDIAGFHEAQAHDASMSILFYGNTAMLRMGAGPDYSLYDVYIDGTLWLSFDGYEATERLYTSPVEHTISVEGTGLHLLEVRNRLEHRIGSTGYKLRFHSLNAQPAFDVMTIDYGYDGLSRLLSADYSAGADYTFGYDVAGNMVNNNGVTRTYNAANQMTNDGTNSLTYDNNGNLTNDGVNAYTWDRANRMLTAPGTTSYKYDGAGNRISQTVSGVVTAYLNDVQPGLVEVLRETDSTNTHHFVHAAHGIHAVDDGSAWQFAVQDGLRSVRGWADGAGALNNPVSYSPYGVPNTSVDGFAYTGEVRDGSGLQYHRARYYKPNMATWTTQDFLETPNRYTYVNGNPASLFDPNGQIAIADDAILIFLILATAATIEAQQENSMTVAGATQLWGGLVNATEGLQSLLEDAWFGWNSIYNNVTGAWNEVKPLQTWWNNTFNTTTHLGGNSNFDSFSLTGDGSFGQDVLPEWTLPGEVTGGESIPVTGGGGAVQGLDPEDLWRNIRDICGAGLIWLLGKLSISIAVSQPVTRTSNKTCNPSAAAQWKYSLRQEPIWGHLMSPNRRNRLRYEYQLRVTNDYYEYRATNGLVTVDADGIRESDCYFLEAKYVEQPWKSPYVVGSGYRWDIPGLLGPAIITGFHIARYTALIRDPNIPIVGLEIHTNEPTALLFFQTALIATPGGRVIVHE